MKDYIGLIFFAICVCLSIVALEIKSSIESNPCHWPRPGEVVTCGDDFISLAGDGDSIVVASRNSSFFKVYSVVPTPMASPR